MGSGAELSEKWQLVPHVCEDKQKKKKQKEVRSHDPAHNPQFEGSNP